MKKIRNMALIGISGKISSGKDTVGKIINLLACEKEAGGFTSIEEALKYYEDGRKQDGTYVYPYQIKKYANKLKEITCLLTGCTLEQLEDQSFKLSKLGPEWDGSYTVNTYRDLLQILGTECGREIIHPNIWVNALFADYQKESIKWDENGNSTLEDYPKWIITDLRFPNELEAVKQRNGITIRVNRYCYDSAEDFLVTHPDKDISKIGLNINMNENSSVIDFEEPARIHGYIPLSEQHPSETALDNATFDYVIENDGTIEELIEKVRQILIKENLL